ncbi:MAG: HAD domain-containing protein [Candidatus Marinimicrobia bacterium]|nr:HAD domain-containing protein [Candidatus Neomarinimicrobiota bacterium]
MKVIFLDIDGVLVTRNSMKYQYLNFPDDASIRFSKNAVKNLNKLIRLTKAKIVISSTWRLFHSLEELQNIFKKQRIRGEIISTTSIERAPVEEDIPRGQKIADWLAQHPEIEKYVIIDDDVQADCIQFHPFNCVETSYKRGFSPEDRFNEALAILNEK